MRWKRLLKQFEWPPPLPPDASTRARIRRGIDCMLNIIGIVCVVLFVSSCIFLIAIGQPILIIAGFLPWLFIWALKAGLGLKDIGFLIWWDGGKK